MKLNTAEQLLLAKRRGTPIIAVSTADQMAFIELVAQASKVSNDKGEDPPPLVRYDVMLGVVGYGDEGVEAIKSALQEGSMDAEGLSKMNPSDLLAWLSKLPKETVVFVMNAHRLLDPIMDGSVFISQAILNLRDPFKQDYRVAVLLGPTIQLPTELQQHVHMLDDPLPEDDVLKDIIQNTLKNSDIKPLKEDVLEKAIDAVRGLAVFPTEQAVALSLTEEGLDLSELWSRKRSIIEQTQGLKISRGDDTYANVEGAEQIKKFNTGIFNGRRPPRVVVWADELEKMMAGLGAIAGVGDNTGITQDQLGHFLKTMEDNDWVGEIYVGPAGSGKSYMAKTTGNTFGVPTIELDLGAMKNSLAGKSEEAIRNALKTIKSVAGNRVLVVATCNKLDILPPELRRRFRLGIWYFDIPTLEEQKACWKLYREKYKIKSSLDPKEYENWTQAEIRNVCDIAWRLKVDLSTAAQYIVPVFKSDADGVWALRDKAHNKFLSASAEGPYKSPPRPGIASPATRASARLN